MPCETPRARDLVLWCYSVFLKVHNNFMSWIFMCCPEIFGDMPLKWFRGTGFPLTLYFLVHNVSVVAVIFFSLPWVSTTMCLHTICPSISGHDLQKLWIKIINCLGNLLRLSKDDWYTASFTCPANIAYFTEGQKPFQCQLSEWLLNIVILKLIKFSLF